MIFNFSEPAIADGVSATVYPSWDFGDQPALPGQPIGQVKETIVICGTPAVQPGVAATADDPSDNQC